MTDIKIPEIPSCCLLVDGVEVAQIVGMSVDDVNTQADAQGPETFGAGKGSLEWETTSAADIVDDICAAFDADTRRGFRPDPGWLVSPAQHSLLKDAEAQYLASEALRKARAAKFEQWARARTFDGKMNRAQRRALERTKPPT
jgi:hypothetical protein